MVRQLCEVERLVLEKDPKADMGGFQNDADVVASEDIVAEVHVPFRSAIAPLGLHSNARSARRTSSQVWMMHGWRRRASFAPIALDVCGLHWAAWML